MTRATPRSKPEAPDRGSGPPRAFSDSAPSWLVYLGWAAVALLLGLLLCAAWLTPDIFYHLFLGQRVVETGSPQPSDNLLVQQASYVNIYWLFQLICVAVYSVGGVVGLSVMFMLVWAGTLFFWQRTAGLWRVPVLGIPLALGAVLLLEHRYEPRPEVFSYLFLSLQLFWLSTWSFASTLPWRRLALFAIVQILWTNMHGYFVLGPMLVGAFLVATLLSRNRTRWPEVGKLFLITSLASLATPLGIKAWVGVFELWRFLREMGSGISEFAPPTGPFLTVWTVKLFWVFWVATVGLCLWLIIRRRWRWFDLFLAGPALYLSATSMRGIPLLLLLSAPLWGQLFATLAAGSAKRSRTRWWLRPISLGLTITITLGLCGWVISGGFHHSLRSETTFGIRLLPHAYPLHFHDYLRGRSFTGKLLNSSADGGFLEYHFPDIHPYIDSRYTDADAVAEYHAGLLDPTTFRRLHARHGLDAVLLKVVDSGPLVEALLADPSWRFVYADLHRVFLVRTDSDQAAALPTLGMQLYHGEDLSQRVGGMAAIQWIGLLVRVDDRAMLLDALGQLAEATHIPSYVIMYALQYGLQHGDDEIIEVARGMYPRMLALKRENRAFVDRLMAATESRAGRVR